MPSDIASVSRKAHILLAMFNSRQFIWVEYTPIDFCKRMLIATAQQCYDSQ